ncbi:signal peptidase I [uncultured Streptomyces sp.]|uniref:signal peptidase I n=1 Tax=uncultured Streptomyces sp. TaxID=174707 RepID=UPI0026203248|nr:signal peptidase I [uncultured Streptomyces sp.]
MDTETQHAERDPSSGPPAGPEEGSRSSRPGGTATEDRGAEGSGAEPAAGEDDAAGYPYARRLLLLGVACVTAVLLVSAFVMQPFLIPSGSMETTLKVGDRVLVNKLAYRFGSAGPARGDIVVFDGAGSFVRTGAPNPLAGALRSAAATLGLTEPSDTVFVKRVVGTGGDHVVCCDARGRIEVNGRAVDETYLHDGDAASEVPFDIVVPDGTLWMMGDHRSASSDSRDHLGQPGGGMVPVEKVLGRVDALAWPFGRLGGVPDTGAFDGVPGPDGARG